MGTDDADDHHTGAVPPARLNGVKIPCLVIVGADTALESDN